MTNDDLVREILERGRTGFHKRDIAADVILDDGRRAATRMEYILRKMKREGCIECRDNIWQLTVAGRGKTPSDFKFR